MDSCEEARDYDAMDHSTVNRVFVADFLAVWDGSNPILDVGTGTALIPIELCRQAPSAKIIAVDMAEHMLGLGRANVARAGLEGRVLLQHADAKHLPHGEATFAAVMSNSIVHHIPQPRQVLAEMTRVLWAGGLLFVRDLRRPPDEATLENLIGTYAGTANSHQQQLFRQSLRAALTVAEVRELVSTLGYEPTAVQQTTDRHWTWQARKPSR